MRRAVRLHDRSWREALWLGQLPIISFKWTQSIEDGQSPPSLSSRPAGLRGSGKSVTTTTAAMKIQVGSDHSNASKNSYLWLRRCRKSSVFCCCFFLNSMILDQPKSNKLEYEDGRAYCWKLVRTDKFQTETKIYIGICPIWMQSYRSISESETEWTFMCLHAQNKVKLKFWSRKLKVFMPLNPATSLETRVGPKFLHNDVKVSHCNALLS